MRAFSPDLEPETTPYDLAEEAPPLGPLLAACLGCLLIALALILAGLTLLDWQVHAELSRQAPVAAGTLARILALDLPASLTSALPLAAVFPGAIALPRWLARVAPGPETRRTAMAAMAFLALVTMLATFAWDEGVAAHTNRAVVIATQQALGNPVPAPGPTEMTLPELNAQIIARRQAGADEAEVQGLLLQRALKLCLPAIAFSNTLVGFALGFLLARFRKRPPLLGAFAGLLVCGADYWLLMKGMSEPMPGVWLPVLVMTALALGVGAIARGLRPLSSG